jgi:hypothetical protein
VQKRSTLIKVDGTNCDLNKLINEDGEKKTESNSQNTKTKRSSTSKGASSLDRNSSLQYPDKKNSQIINEENDQSSDMRSIDNEGG